MSRTREESLRGDVERKPMTFADVTLGAVWREIFFGIFGFFGVEKKGQSRRGVGRAARRGDRPDSDAESARGFSAQDPLVTFDLRETKT